jgi:hypothetical protein
MFVAVMQIGIVRVLVHNPSVMVQMAVWLASEIARQMPMLVMRVVEMTVLVFEGLMQMLVLVRLRKVLNRRRSPSTAPRR